MEKKIFTTFKEWYDALATMPAHELKTREDFAFCDSNCIPDKSTDVYKQFCTGWKSRFGYRDTIQEIKQAGWYNLSAKACEGVYDTYPERLRTCINVWGPQRLASIKGRWEKTFPKSGDEAPVIARIEIDSRFGPWIAEISWPITKALQLIHNYNGNSWWTLEDGNGFSIQLPPPGHIPFQRAATLIYQGPGAWHMTSAIVLEWIFAGGQGNVLIAADAALSGRTGETIASARRKVRAAMA